MSNKSPDAVRVAASWTGRIPLWTTLLCGIAHLDVKWGEMGVGGGACRLFSDSRIPGIERKEQREYESGIFWVQVQSLFLLQICWATGDSVSPSTDLTY